MANEIAAPLTASAWEQVQLARKPGRPILEDYLALLFDDFVELKGDRAFGDDRALIGGFARLEGRRLMVVGHNKGKNVEANVERNFGMARPEGYRKALRLMRLAEKYGLPVVTLVDTPGAYPGLDAEARGQAEAIARNLHEMAGLEVPIVTVVTGEGGSGGALGIAVADAVLMLEHAIYSVISPEGCASILWRDASAAPDAAEALRLTASALADLGVIDEIVPEPDGGAHLDPPAAAAEVGAAVGRNLDALASLGPDALVERRFRKLASWGVFRS